MFIELIAVFAAGAGAAGLVLALNLITRGRLPKWAMPVAAGAAMIALSVSNELTWGTRTVEGLPDGLTVIEEVAETSWWRPWTYVAPQTVRIMAVDQATLRRNPAATEVLLAELYLFGRWRPTSRVPQLVHCADGVRAGVTEAALQDPTAANWVPADPAFVAAICSGDPHAG